MTDEETTTSRKQPQDKPDLNELVRILIWGDSRGTKLALDYFKRYVPDSDKAGWALRDLLRAEVDQFEEAARKTRMPSNAQK